MSEKKIIVCDCCGQVVWQDGEKLGEYVKHPAFNRHYCQPCVAAIWNAQPMDKEGQK